MSLILPVLHPSSPVFVLSCICTASVHSCIHPVLHPSCPSYEYVLFCICVICLLNFVLLSSFPVYVLSCISLVPRSASILSSVCSVLLPSRLVHFLSCIQTSHVYCVSPVLNVYWPPSCPFKCKFYNLFLKERCRIRTKEFASFGK